MASGSSNILAALSVRLTTDASKFMDGLNTADGQMKILKRGLAQLGSTIGLTFGAGALAVGVFKGALNSSGIAQDEFAKAQDKIKAATDLFFQSLTHEGLKDFGKRLREVTEAVGEYYDAMDRMGHLQRSLSVQWSLHRVELGKLEEIYKDNSKSLTVRQDAISKYESIVKDLTGTEKQYAAQEKGFLLDKLEAMLNINRQVISGFVTEYSNWENVIEKGKEYNELIAKRKLYEDGAFNAGVSGAALYSDKLDDVNSQLNILGKDAELFGKIAQAFDKAEAEKKGLSYLDQLKTAIEKEAAADYKYYQETLKLIRVKNGLLSKENKLIKENTELYGADNPLYINTPAEEIDMPTASDLMTDESLTTELQQYYDESLARTTKFYNDWAAEAQRMADINANLTDTIKNGLDNMVVSWAESLGEIMGGAEDFDIGAAILGPIADMISSLGKMLVTTGIGILAFKTSLESLNPYVAIAAGAALIALAAMVKTSISNIPNNGGGTVATPSAGSGSNPNLSAIRYFGDRNKIYFEGIVSGGDLVLVERRNEYRRSITT